MEKRAKITSHYTKSWLYIFVFITIFDPRRYWHPIVGQRFELCALWCFYTGTVFLLMLEWKMWAFDGLTLKQVTQVCCASEHSFTSHRIVIKWTYSPLKQIPLSLWSEHYYNSVSVDLEKSTSKKSVRYLAICKLSFKTKRKCV